MVGPREPSATPRDVSDPRPGRASRVTCVHTGMQRSCPHWLPRPSGNDSLLGGPHLPWPLRPGLTVADIKALFGPSPLYP